MAKLTYLSHAAFLLEGGGHKILIDPFFTGNPKAPVKPEEVSCNFIIITHGHGDHVGDAVDIAKRNNATVIANYEIAIWCNQQGVQNVHPLHIGGGHDFPFGRVKLTIAHHGSGFQTEEGFLYLGNPAGALITVEGKNVYHAGDTGLFYDMKLIGEQGIDVALLPIGDNFTMGIDDAVKATEFLNPKLVIPMHYKTFDVIDVEPSEFVQKVQAKGFKAQVIEFGGSIEF
ncbi:MAG: metal-dependent hydrolase [Calditrichaeota bacterium]|nr:MAG: metal-dependent hydrolase [Calditrichota bacterium]